MSGQTTVSSNSKQSKGMSIAGMILGIVGLLFSFTCFYWFAIILAIVGVSLSAIGMKNADQDSKGMAIAGLATSIVALVISIIWTIIWYAFFAVSSFAADAVIDGAFDSLDNYDWSNEFDNWDREYQKTLDEFEKEYEKAIYDYTY